MRHIDAQRRGLRQLLAEDSYFVFSNSLDNNYYIIAILFCVVTNTCTTVTFVRLGGLPQQFRNAYLLCVTVSCLLLVAAQRTLSNLGWLVGAIRTRLC